MQTDGSRHDWLEGRGPWLTLIGVIDDATGEILHALFREQEDTEGYFNLLRNVISGYGVPLAVYHDGHSVFEPPEGEPKTIEEPLEDKKGLTQFGRLLKGLDITSLSGHARRSPEAESSVFGVPFRTGW